MQTVWKSTRPKETHRTPVPSIRTIVKPYLTLNPSGWWDVSRALHAYVQEPLWVNPRILRLQVEPTLRCNLDCVMCHAERRGAARKDLSLPAFRRILESFPSLRNLMLQGVGEPLLNPAFFDMVRHARSQGVFVQTFTNGTLLKKDRIFREIRDSGLNVLNVSFDSADKATYESVRRGAVYEDVVDGIRRMAQETQRDPRAPRVAAWMVRTRENAGTLWQTIQFLGEAGIRTVVLQPEHSWGIPKRLDARSSSAARQDGGLKAKAREKGIRLLVVERSGAGRRCKWPWYCTNVTVEGCVTPCCMQGADPALISFGNLFRTPFREIWNGPSYREFRSRLRSEDPPGICRGCPGY